MSQNSNTLFLKYRPQNFDDLVGHQLFKTIIQNSITSNKMSHAYLFSGSRGTGKTSIARIIAKSLLCQNRKADGNPCDQCDFCTNIRSGSLIDVQEIDAASNTSIEDIRALQEKINFLPTLAPAKIYILDEIHMLSKGAFNALLKTIEEPPNHVYFIFATTEIHKVPDTIISRCQRFDFGRFKEIDITDRLNYIAQQEKLAYEPAALEIFANRSNGGMRDAIGMLEKFSTTGKKITADFVTKTLGIVSSHELQRFYKFLIMAERQAALDFLHQVDNQGGDLKSFIDDLLMIARQYMLNDSNPSTAILIIETFQQIYEQIRYTRLKIIPIEIAIIKITTKTNLITKNSNPEIEIIPPVQAPTPPTTTVKENITTAVLKPQIQMSSNAQDTILNTKYPIKHQIKLSMNTENPPAKITTTNPKTESKSTAQTTTTPNLKTQILTQLTGSVATTIKNSNIIITKNNITIITNSEIEKNNLKKAPNYNKISAALKMDNKQQLTLNITNKTDPTTTPNSNTTTKDTINSCEYFKDFLN